MEEEEVTVDNDWPPLPSSSARDADAPAAPQPPLQARRAASRSNAAPTDPNAAWISIGEPVGDPVELVPTGTAPPTGTEAPAEQQPPAAPPPKTASPARGAPTTSVHPNSNTATQQQPPDAVNSSSTPTGDASALVVLLKLQIVLERSACIRRTIDVEMDSHGTVGELRRIVHEGASRYSDYEVADPDRIFFPRFPIPRRGANNNIRLIRVTSDVFL